MMRVRCCFGRAIAMYTAAVLLACPSAACQQEEGSRASATAWQRERDGAAFGAGGSGAQYGLVQDRIREHLIAEALLRASQIHALRYEDEIYYFMSLL